MGVLDLSHLKVHSVVAHAKPSLGKRKLKQVEGVFTKKCASVLKVDETELDKDQRLHVDRETQAKADDLDYLVDCMKMKLKVASRRQKLQVLMLVPNSWSLRKAADVFSVSKSTVQKARLLCDQKGIAEYPDLVR